MRGQYNGSMSLTMAYGSNELAYTDANGHTTFMTDGGTFTACSGTFFEEEPVIKTFEKEFML